jgi:acyl-CoA synthetase (AMP-forming)/AMP-acid ligase II
MIRKTARKLASLGISRGDAVGIRLADTIDNLVTALAIARIGAVQLAIDRHSTSEEWADLSAAHDLQITVAAAGTQAPHGVAAVALDDEWYSDVRRAPDELTLPDD